MSDFIDNLKKNAKVFLEWCRLRKRIKKHTVMVYWWRDTDGSVFASLGKPRDYSLIGTSTVEFTEP